MTRPHRWAYGATRRGHGVRCERCGALADGPGVRSACPVVTTSDAFAALAWALGQVWRTVAYSLLCAGHDLRIGHDRVRVYLSRTAGGWVVESAVGYQWTGYDLYDDGDDAIAAALELIERDGDG